VAHTDDDILVWLMHHPEDLSYSDEAITGTFGFQTFVLGRRMVELRQAFVHELGPMADRFIEAYGRRRRLRAWWWLKRLQLRHWWQHR
jgi:hypothetical protein